MNPTKEAERIANLVNTPEFAAAIESSGIVNELHPDDKAELDDFIYMFLFAMTGMKLTPGLADKDRIKEIYLEELPIDWPFLSEDTFKIHLMLMRLYFILGKEGIITKTEAEEIVLFLQGAQESFYHRMQDITLYSPKKQEFYTMARAQFHEYGRLGGSFAELLKLAAEDDDEFDYLTEENFAYQIRVDLEGFKPPIWRRLIVPATITYADLHEILQIAFDWQDQHLWNFTVDGRRIDAVENEFDDDLYSEEPELAAEVIIDDDFDLVNNLTYLYDFGDDWSHKIKIEKRLNDDRYLDEGPVLIKLVGDTPAEDSRGKEAWVKADGDKILKKLHDHWRKGLDEGRF